MFCDILTSYYVISLSRLVKVRWVKKVDWQAEAKLTNIESV